MGPSFKTDRMEGSWCCPLVFLPLPSYPFFSSLTSRPRSHRASAGAETPALCPMPPPPACHAPLRNLPSMNPQASIHFPNPVITSDVIISATNLRLARSPPLIQLLNLVTHLAPLRRSRCPCPFSSVGTQQISSPGSELNPVAPLFFVSTWRKSGWIYFSANRGFLFGSW